MLPYAVSALRVFLLAGALAVTGCAAEPRTDVQKAPASTLTDTPASLSTSADAPTRTAGPPSAIHATAEAIPTAIPPATAAASPAAAALPDHGPAPELSNDTWLNTDAPLRLADLRGKVVLIEFWTYG